MVRVRSPVSGFIKYFNLNTGKFNFEHEDKSFELSTVTL